MSIEKVNFRDDEGTRLAADLLDGQKPTPARVRKLLQELSERRKAKPMSLEDLEHEAATSAGIALPAAPALSGPEPASQEAADHVTDEEQSELIRAGIESFRAFDESRRKAIMQRPVSALRGAGRLETLSQAAGILLAELDPGQRDRVLEIAEENGWPPWVVVLGAVARSADLQELLSGEMKPEWLSTPERTERVAVGEAKCEACGAAIPGARRGQKFCCSAHGSEKDGHSEGCPCSYMVLTNGSWVDTRR